MTFYAPDAVCERFALLGEMEPLTHIIDTVQQPFGDVVNAAGLRDKHVTVLEVVHVESKPGQLQERIRNVDVNIDKINSRLRVFAAKAFRQLGSCPHKGVEAAFHIPKDPGSSSKRVKRCG